MTNNETNPAISRAIEEIVAPWDQAGLNRPSLTVLEVARTARSFGQPANSADVATFASEAGLLRDRQDHPVDGNLTAAALASTPHKRAHRNSDPASFRATSLTLGMGRLHISFPNR